MIIIPATKIQIFGFKIPCFHFWGLTGFVVSLLTAIVLGVLVSLNMKVVGLIAAGALFSSFMLAYLQKVFTGREVLVYYHHEITIVLFNICLLVLLKMPVLPYLDLTTLALAIVLGFGRIGCFSVGCCHGMPHTRGVCYGKEHVEAGFTWYYRDIPLFPIQLVESFFVAIITFAGAIIFLSEGLPGTVFVFYTAAYGLFRFVAEFFRGDPVRPYLHGLSEAQWISWCLIGFSLTLAHLGMLPIHLWHQVAFGGLTCSCIFIMCRSSRKRIEMSALHIQQIAEALSLLEQFQQKNSPSYTRTIPVYETKQGLSISIDKYISGNSLLHQYAVSRKGQKMLDGRLVTKLAKHIQTLKKHSASFRIFAGKSGVYHILFEEKIDNWKTTYNFSGLSWKVN